MQLHELQPTTRSKSKKRVGRGGKRGTYSGKGQKGQKSRAGRKMRPGLRDQLISTPKLRGYKNKRKSDPAVAISVAALMRVSEETITPEVLVTQGMLRRGRRAKIVANGELTVKKNISGIAVSAGAKAKIEKAGGTVQ